MGGKIMKKTRNIVLLIMVLCFGLFLLSGCVIYKLDDKGLTPEEQNKFAIAKSKENKAKAEAVGNFFNAVAQTVKLTKAIVTEEHDDGNCYNGDCNGNNGYRRNGGYHPRHGYEGNRCWHRARRGGREVWVSGPCYSRR